MNHLQINFHLPDLVITEIYRHVHQFFIAQLNQEYHQTWKLDMNYITYRDRAPLHVLVRKDIYQNYYYYAGNLLNARDCPIINRWAWLPKTRQLLNLPKNYWYSSGKGNPNGYLEF